MIRYYIVRTGQRFWVRREGVGKGEHQDEARAIQAATFMAAVEASQLGLACEVLRETPTGRWETLETFVAKDPARCEAA